MASLQELLAKRAALEEEIQDTRKRERQDAVAKVKALMVEYGLSVSDLSGKAPTSKPGIAKGSKVAAKYRNKATGETWSGRGLQPNWLKAALAAGKKISDFEV